MTSKAPRDLKLVGKIIEAYGLKGELFVHVLSKEFLWINKIKAVSLGLTTEAPEREYQVTRAAPHRHGVALRLAGVDDRNKAEAIEKQFVFIAADLLVSRKGEAIYLNEILGFTVVDDEKALGPIEGFSSNGPQDLLVVRLNAARLVEIPFVEAFLVDIDFQNKKVLMNLPPGLVEEDA